MDLTGQADGGHQTERALEVGLLDPAVRQTSATPEVAGERFGAKIGSVPLGSGAARRDYSMEVRIPDLTEAAGTVFVPSRLRRRSIFVELMAGSRRMARRVRCRDDRTLH